MPRFRKLPVVVDATRYMAGGDPIEGVELTGAGTAFIRTLEGDMEVKPGAWVITGIMGERYPCDADIFEKTYEAVIDPAGREAK